MSSLGWLGWAGKKRPAVRLQTEGLYYINAAATSALVPKGTKSLPRAVRRNGVVQDALNNWVEAWEVADMFSDTTEDGVTTTKAEHEAAYQAQLDSNAAESNRTQRDRLIGETDWWASSDLTMTAEQTAYRQALRDITSHANWPHLDEADWPTKP